MCDRDTDTQPSISSEEFLRNGRDVRICPQAGFLCKVRMKALIDIPPEEVFLLLTSAKNSRVFSSIDKTIRRDVISENSSERVIYQEQLTHAGRGVFKKTFTTACFVTEYLSKLSADFSLAKPGIMSSFQGHWSLTPVSPEAYSRLSAERRPQEPWEKELLEAASDTSCCKLGPSGTTGSSMKTLMYLEQDVGPAAARKVPPVFRGILRRMCAAAAVDVFKDLTVVAALRHKGLPTDTVLDSDVHGRGGLKSCLLQKPRSLSDTSSAAMGNEEAMGKGATFIGDGASSSTSSPIQSFAFDCAESAVEDFDDAMDDTFSSVAGSSSALLSPRIIGLNATSMASPRVLQYPTPPRTTLQSFKLLDFEVFAEDDVVE